MTKYARTILPALENALFKGKGIVIYGPRQVGKTTLVREVIARQPDGALYLNCDEPDVRAVLTEQTSTALGALVGTRRLVVIDEAQRVQNIGLTLKLMVDNLPNLQVIATGSSSFALSNSIIEPLTGRKIEFNLLPLSAGELLSQETPQELNRLLEQRLRFGLYPGVVTSDDPASAVLELATNYLYRDALEYQTVKNPDMLRRLLQALALQVGSEVSYNELSRLLQIDKATVDRYVSLLEQAYVIFHLSPFSRNLRHELSRLRKIYFYDVGIRNALINNFNPLSMRQDVGALWENYFISERLKSNENARRHVNRYFWRTYDGAEVDYLEEAGGRLTGFECKWSSDKWRLPAAFGRAYPDSELKLANRETYLTLLAEGANE